MCYYHSRLFNETYYRIDFELNMSNMPWCNVVYFSYKLTSTNVSGIYTYSHYSVL